MIAGARVNMSGVLYFFHSRTRDADTPGRRIGVGTTSALIPPLHPNNSPGKEFTMIRKAIALACAAAALLLAACNTIQGAGKDIERGGEKLQGAAEKAKQ